MSSYSRLASTTRRGSEVTMKRGLALPLRPFCLADDAARAAPARQRGPAEVAEPAGRLAAGLGQDLRLLHLGLDLRAEALIARQTEDVVDPVGLRPHHQVLAAEAAVTTQQNADPRPAGADAADEADQFLHRARSGIDVGPAQLRRQQMAATEDVQRQIAVAVVVAMEEPAFLMPVQRIVRG